MMVAKRPVVPIISGLTASGKSTLALTLCERYNGEIISADSMQIYLGLDIGTAKPTSEEQARVPHHLIDIIRPGERYSVASFVSDARRLVNDVLARGKMPIVCGGSVQYTSALLEGLSFQQLEVSSEDKEKVLFRIKHEGMSAMLEKLRSLDPETGENLSVSDERKIIRFFEVYEATGQTRSEVNLRSREEEMPFDFRAICLLPPASFVYERINNRTEHMFTDGLLAECQKLRNIYPEGDTTTVFQGIGYKWTYRHLIGELTLQEAIELTKRDTRRYAKRQRTWYRHHAGYQLFDSSLESFDGEAEFLSLFKG